MKRVLGTCLVVSLLLASSSAWALPTLDQYQEGQNGGITSTLATLTPMLVGQTFTAGLSGLLDHVDIGNTFGHTVLPAGTPTVQIRNTVAGSPGSTVLGSFTLSTYLPTNGWGSFDFLGQSIPITAGQMYFIEVLPGSGNNVTIGRNSDPASYAGGDLWVHTNDVWYMSPTWTGDIQFRTYVEAISTIPAPGALVLGSLGAGFVAWFRRRRTL